jgi:hypothetical protein
MRTNFVDKCRPHDEDDMHSVPIQDMGNYHEYLKNQAQPLREIEAQMVRQHMFGNPFKLVSKDQKNGMGGMFGADEIDEILEESAENSNNTAGSGNNNQKSNQQQQQLLLQQQQQQQSRRGVRQRRSVKGPLSKRINYLKSLYTQNSNSSSASTISDSDIEILDDVSSMASDSTGSQFTTLTGDASTLNSDTNDKSQIDSNLNQIEPDVANLNDFNDLDVEMQQQQMETNELNDEVIEINQNENKLLSVDMNDNEIVNSALRSTSAVSGAFSSPNELLLDANNLLTGMTGGSSALCDNYLEQSYIQLKVLCIEQIKKPGKEHSRLFQLIQDSPLTLRLRYFLLRELAHEASRFKRFGLVQLMSKYAGLLQQLANATVSNGQAIKNE